MEAFFLGLIAFSMIVIAIMAIIRTIFWIILILKLKKVIDTIYLDYNKIYSPKFSILIENITSLTGVFKLLRFLRRGR